MARPDYSAAVYIDDRVKTERWVRRNSTDESAGPRLADECEPLRTTVDSLLDVCKEIYLCHSGSSFTSALAELNEESGNDCTPIFAFFDVEADSESVFLRRREARDSTTGLRFASPAPLHRSFSFSAESEHSYGVQLLALLSSDLQLQEEPKLIIPVAILRRSEPSSIDESGSAPSEHDNRSLLLSEPALVARCLDAGAVDVLTQPLERTRVHGLLVHAQRVRRSAQKEIARFMSIKKSRKQSWVGVHNEQPYAYLREAMVSKLMGSICNPQEVIEEFQDPGLNIADERKLLVERKVGDWDFPAHDFSEDELVYAAYKMLGHAMTMPEVDYLRLTDRELRIFLLASRAAYNSFVLYHNFRHAVDVLQSVFSMLLHIGALPPYPQSPSSPFSKSPIATLLTPFDALSLLIAAIGHDVGHPGVNNVFLVKLNAPLAQLYNDSSVLEAFHCAAFSQILRRHWPAAFGSTDLRKLLISSILATDMGVHFKFMGRMEDLRKKYHADADVANWDPQDLDTYRALLCGLIIKCADISNVARPWQIAEKWTNILQEEFAHQGEMEKAVGMETALFGGPPELGNLLKLATGQINFMSIFALPLFEGVADLLPQVSFAVQQIQSNRTIWQEIADQEQRRQLLLTGMGPEIARSPRSVSPALAEPQVDGAGDGQPLSSLQENGIGGNGATNVKITLDQPPDCLVSSPSPVTQKRIAENQVDLSKTTVSGFRTPSQRSSTVDVMDQLQRISSVPDLRFESLTQQNRKSYCSGHASLPSSSHGVGRDTRTQSASTCTNTVATPVSPVTNATSFVTVDSGDEREPPAYGLNTHELDLRQEETASRPSSSGIHAVMDRQRFESSNRSFYYPHPPRTSQRMEDFGKNHRVMTAILRNGVNSGGSSPVDDENLKPGNGVRFDPQPTLLPRALTKRKSRLRLAFWRRREPHLQQPRMSGEI